MKRITFERERNDKQIDIKTEIIYFLWAPQILLRLNFCFSCVSSVSVRGRRRQPRQHKEIWKTSSPCRLLDARKSFFFPVIYERRRRSEWKPLPSINMEIENETPCIIERIKANRCEWCAEKLPQKAKRVCDSISSRSQWDVGWKWFVAS